MNKHAKRAINFTVIGAGEGGGRIAAAFAKLGYRAGAINTAQVDLQGLRAIPAAQRLRLNIGLGGAGQDLTLGRAAIAQQRGAVREFMTALCVDADYLLLTIGGGGGTGSGAVPELVALSQELGLPCAVILTLPHDYEGVRVKANAVQTLQTAHELVQTGAIRPLVLVDNARIDTLFPGLAVGNYWARANREIAGAWDVFNRLSTRPSVVFSAVDGADYARVLARGSYAALGVSPIGASDEGAIAQALRGNIHNGLFANGFDLATAQATAAIISGSQAALDRLPMNQLMRGFETLRELVGSGELFRGAYVDKGAKLRVYTLMAGLSLPGGRVGELLQAARAEWGAYQAKLQRGAGGGVFADCDFNAAGGDDVFLRLAQRKRA